MEALQWLEEWYASQCDGDWEHMCGIRIYSLDNPGWAIEIDLLGTVYSGFEMKKIIRNGNINWYSCAVEEGRFRGMGDSTMLSTMIRAFQRHIEDCDRKMKDNT